MMPEMDESVSKENQDSIFSQLQDVLEKVQSARRHLPFSGVPDGYLYQAEGMLQEALEKLKKV